MIWEGIPHNSTLDFLGKRFIRTALALLQPYVVMGRLWLGATPPGRRLQ